MTSHANQLSLILHEQGLENYSNAVQELVRSIDYSTRFVTKFDFDKFFLYLIIKLNLNFREAESRISAVDDKIESLKTEIAQKNISRLEKQQMKEEYEDNKGLYFLNLINLM